MNFTANTGWLVILVAAVLVGPYLATYVQTVRQERNLLERYRIVDAALEMRQRSVDDALRLRDEKVTVVLEKILESLESPQK